MFAPSVASMEAVATIANIEFYRGVSRIYPFR